MPIYEYECSKCGVMEVTQRITEDALAKCPQCKRRKVKKLISNTSFQLKGSGWYVTDYGKGGDKGSKSGDSESSASGSTESSGDAKADTKSEAKSDSGKKKSSGSKKKDSKKAA